MWVHVSGSSYGIGFEFEGMWGFPEEGRGERPNDCHAFQAEVCSDWVFIDLHQDAVASVPGMQCVLLPQKPGSGSW